MCVTLTLLYPGEGHHQTIFVFLLVCEFAVNQFVGTLYRATLNDFIAAEDAVDDVDVLRRRAHLNGDRTAIVREAKVVRLIEPVVGLGDGPLIVKREDDELLLDGIFLANSLQLVFSALQLGQLEGGVRLLRLPLATIDTVAYLVVDVVAGGIAQVELHVRHLVCTNLIRQFAGECRLAVTKRQRQLSLMGFTSLVSHVGQADEVVEHREVGLRQHHRHFDGKGTVAARDSIAFGNRLVIGEIAYGTAIPVGRIAPPPERTAAHHLVMHLSILNGHSGIGAGRCLYFYRVAVLVILIDLVELHLERRPFVFLHIEATGNATDTTFNVELASQAVGRECEFSRSRTIFICCYRLLGNCLIVGIAQRQFQFFALQCLMLIAVSHLIGNSGHVYLLTGTVDGTVGK